ncbi:hypothetical protein ACIQVL_48805 [Streptomyces sp. NPDC090499]|uniref:hypothetical protein n=1 Tax=Streptomyces sp. NPDC090499 TaxID=3365965 RepID=UPI00381FCEE0
MTVTVQALVTEAELANWLAETVGPKVVDDYGATTTQLLAVFDLAEKDGCSLNNPSKIGSVISPTPALTSEPFAPYVPLTAQAAARHLTSAFYITRKPADYERLLVDLPMPVIVSRHQCPFCRRYTRASLTQVQDHMTRCWQNPALRCCKTCTHHQTASGTPGSPDEWLEACTSQDGPEYEDYQFPVLHCPLWQPKET